MLDPILNDGLVLVGCGKMGSALLRGWLETGIPADRFTVMEPTPSDDLIALAKEGLNLNGDLPDNPAAMVLAVKPQMMRASLQRFFHFGNGNTVFISVAAGVSLATYEQIVGAMTPIVRTMPNTPASIAKGVTALVANSPGQGAPIDMAEALMQAVGETVRLTSEDQMDAVTAVSGSGPAYVFHFIEAMCAAGIAEGLEPSLALKLAEATVSGAGAMALTSREHPSKLRIDVTSPGGTTAAALQVLMREDAGLGKLVAEAVHQAAQRSRELASQ
ncbi:MAG: pyrroline-5-carboxylate reductase [Pseudomonadota bacterium]